MDRIELDFGKDVWDGSVTGFGFEFGLSLRLGRNAAESNCNAYTMRTITIVSPDAQELQEFCML